MSSHVVSMEFGARTIEFISGSCGEPSIIVFFVFTVAFGVFKLIEQYRKTQRNRHFQEERSVKKLFQNKMSNSGGFSGFRSSNMKASSWKQSSCSRTMKPDIYCSPMMREGSSTGDEDELDTGANLRFEKLRIGSPDKQGLRSRSNSPYYPLFNPPLIFNSSLTKPDTGPLWKDYPMVQKVVPSGYSFCSAPLSSPYPNSGFSSPLISRNYRSSSMATIFGGPKPVLSPPKLDIGYSSGLMNHPEGAYSPSSAYSCGSSHGRPWGLTPENLVGPYMTSPLSRSSSQSSGFISQKGPNTPPPSGVGYTSLQNSVCDGRDQEVLSIYSDPNSCSSVRRRRSFPSGFISFPTINPYEVSLTDGQTWSSSAANQTVKPVSTSGANTVGNTCSRFARKDSDSNLFMKHLIDIRSARSSVYSEDSDYDDDASFKSAVTSLTRVTRIGSKPDCEESSDILMQSKTRRKTNLRNLRSELLHNDLKKDKCSSTNMTVESLPKRDGVWSIFHKIFWFVSLLLNVVVILFLVFYGSLTTFTESSQQLFYNFTDVLVTNVPLHWNTIQQAVLDVLAARELPNSLVLNDEF